MTEFILELFSEEIPARMQKKALQHLFESFTNFLIQNHVSWESCEGHLSDDDPSIAPMAYITPRRMVLAMRGLPLTQEDIHEEVKGPRIDAPQAAVEGFLKGQNISRDLCEEREVPGKGVFLFAKFSKKGKPIEEILNAAVLHVLNTFYWPKKMRWGSDAFEWVRPLKRVSAVFNGKALAIIPPHSAIDVRGYTEGHRFLAHHEFKITTFEAYKENLRHAYVMLDREERKRNIVKDMEKIALKHDLSLHIDQDLLEEVVGLIEWPHVLMGQIEGMYMTLPEEVLVITMAQHQRYFPTYTKEGKIAPFFFIVSNMETADDGNAIVKGNERVLSARFSDAAFYWERDLKTPLNTWYEALQEKIFYAPLGTMQDKVKRLERLAAYLEPQNKMLQEAAHFSKVDLSSGVVGEFPDLQGIMGSYYATHQNFSKEVAVALKDHYLPKGGYDDALPKDHISWSLSLIDRVDTLVSFFSIGVIPTGSKDPYALRRQAISIMRLLLEAKKNFDLFALFHHAYEGVIAKKDSWEQVFQKLKEFMKDRFEVYLRDSNFGESGDLLTIRKALPFFENRGCLYGTAMLAKELRYFLKTEEGVALTETYKRASNILMQVERKDKRTIMPLNVAGTLQSQEEKTLFDVVHVALEKTTLFEKGQTADFKELFMIFASLHQPLSRFFEAVMVMDEDAIVRERRLSLLASVRALFLPYVDLDV